MSYAEYRRDWRAKNADREREKDRAYRTTTREGRRLYMAQWNAANPSKYKGYHLKKAYGITLEQKQAMFVAQGCRCGICGTDQPGTKLGWSVDADHTVKPARVRGILCKNCNTSLGNFRHDPALLAIAIDWLKR